MSETQKGEPINKVSIEEKVSEKVEGEVQQQKFPSSKAFDLLAPKWKELTLYILAMSIGSL